jgi:hypothetical protein
MSDFRLRRPRLEATEKQMTPEEVTKAKALMAAWKPKTSSSSGASKK